MYNFTFKPNAHKGTHSHLTTKFKKISQALLSSVNSILGLLKNPLVLHHLHQQPILITRTLTLHHSKNLKAKVYTRNILLMNVSKMQKNTLKNNEKEVNWLKILSYSPNTRRWLVLIKILLLIVEALNISCHHRISQTICRHISSIHHE